VIAALYFCLIISSPSQTYRPLEHLESGATEFTHLSTLGILAAGSSAAALSYLADDKVKKYFAGKNKMSGWRQFGNIYGDYPAQFGLATLSLVLGLIQSSNTLLNFGEADLEALSLASAVDAAFKYSIHRDRPSGEKQSFPSGHSTRRD
jgi:hypothetical protein